MPDVLATALAAALFIGCTLFAIKELRLLREMRHLQARHRALTERPPR